MFLFLVEEVLFIFFDKMECSKNDFFMKKYYDFKENMMIFFEDF